MIDTLTLFPEHLTFCDLLSDFLRLCDSVQFPTVDLSTLLVAVDRRSDQAMSRHRNIWIEAMLWLIAEIILSSSGLDTLADYNEFLMNQKTTAMVQATQVANCPRILAEEIQEQCC